MKALYQYIKENIANEKSKYKKCKTFNEFFRLYTGCETPEELTKDNFNSFDYGFLFNREDLNYKEFIEWLKSVWDNKISGITVKVLDNVYNITFKMDGETFDLDAVNGD